MRRTLRHPISRSAMVMLQGKAVMHSGPCGQGDWQVFLHALTDFPRALKGSQYNGRVRKTRWPITVLARAAHTHSQAPKHDT